MENAKLTANLKTLRQSIETKNGPAELQKQFESLQEELSRKKEESIQLRSVLASKQPNQETLSGDDEHEIGLILKTQKTVSLLLSQLQVKSHSRIMIICIIYYSGPNHRLFNNWRRNYKMKN